MIYTCKPEESFDPEILRQELQKQFGGFNWYINTSGNTVEFVKTEPDDYDPESTILAHFANGATREANKAILKQIAELEKLQDTPRRIREAMFDPTWMKDLDVAIN